MEFKILFRKIKKKIYKITFGKRRLPHLVAYKPLGNLNAMHISAFSYMNVGDTLLPVVLRDLFNQSLGVKKWTSKPVHDYVEDLFIKKCNKSDFVVVGGGGLFLSDTASNDVSGWQWNCSIKALNGINKPIIAFALGYNRFRGQEDFKPIFSKHLNAFVDKAVFVGIRNHGSIAKLKAYLIKQELKDKLVYQPCMTTLISKIYPKLCDYNKKENFVAFNCAFDRFNLRSKNDDFLYGIADVAKELSKFISIKYYSHLPSDKWALKYFDEIGVEYELVEFYGVNQIVRDYSKPKLVIGMRGHAQMIPFGCHTPILSVISHDKMQWFLDDIGHPEWGVEITDIDFKEKLLNKANFLLENFQWAIQEEIQMQEKLWEITQKNMNIISNSING